MEERHDEVRHANPSPTSAGDPAAQARRSKLNRAAALYMHSRYDSKALTAPARARFLERFEREVRLETDDSVSEAEILRRVEARKRAYFTKLSVRAADARQRRASGR